MCRYLMEETVWFHGREIKEKIIQKMDDYELSFSLNFENNSAEPITIP